MKTTRNIVFFVSILTIAIGIIGFPWLGNCSSPLNGKASLSKEEKQILNHPFEDCRNHDYRRKAYKIAMICLKHRLTFAEVKELVQGPVGVRVHPDTGESALHYRFSLNWDGWLIFEFNSNGNLTDVCFKNRPYQLPPMKFITYDTPVEAPPLPYREDSISLLARDEIRKQSQVIDRLAHPPNFIRSTYADAMIAAGMAIYAVEEFHRPVVPGYSSQIINQLSNENLSDDKKALAIYLLSEVTPRDTDSIQAAIKWIDCKVNVSYSDPDWRSLHPWSQYPARDALLRIGEASIGSIVQDLPGETNALRRQLLCAVVSTFGRTNWITAWQPKPAIEQLQRLRSTESDQSRQQNIDAALELLIDNKVDLNIGWSGYLGE